MIGSAASDWPAYHLPVASLRFVATAEEAMALPPHLGSALRGVFGHALKDVACLQKEAGAPCAGCREDEVARADGRATRCVYGYLFETPRLPAAVSGDRRLEATHPYVIRSVEVPHDVDGRPPAAASGTGDARLYPAGAPLAFEVNLFGDGIDHVGVVVEACVRMLRRGLGAERAVAEVRELWEQDPFGYAQRSLPFRIDRAGLTLVAGWGEAVARTRTLASRSIALQFLTPAYLVRDGQPIDEPEFAVVARALLRRLTSLAAHHGGEVPEHAFRQMAWQAEGVRLVPWQGAWREWERYSSRQDRRMPFGGLVGVAVYEGALEPYLPYLVYGQATHIGKRCSFGEGRYRIVGGGVPDNP